jgi:hypothetical protein
MGASCPKPGELATLALESILWSRLSINLPGLEFRRQPVERRLAGDGEVCRKLEFLFAHSTIDPRPAKAGTPNGAMCLEFRLQPVGRRSPGERGNFLQRSVFSSYPFGVRPFPA